PGPGPNIPGGGIVGEVAGKAVAAVKGQVGTARAVVTTQVETHLRNAREELREEHVEIALYSTIETFATEVGDRETAKLAREIKRDEERMAKFLEAEMPRLVKELVKAKIPREQRTTPTRARSRAGSARPSSRSRSRATAQTTRRQPREAGAARK
ncbi:MAG TPA: DUF892 family protein, partial [Solirubrobacteraceae bacterium]